MIPCVKSLFFPLVLAHVDDSMWLHRGTYVRHGCNQKTLKLGFFHFQFSLSLSSIFNRLHLSLHLSLTLKSRFKVLFQPQSRSFLQFESNRHYLLVILLYSNMRNVKSSGSISYVCRFEFEKESNYRMQVWRRNSC